VCSSDLEYYTPAAANVVGQAIVDLQNGTAAATAGATNAAASKATPVDADVLPLADSAASFGLKKLSWANLKLAIGLYYNSLTATLTNKTISQGKFNNLFDTNNAYMIAFAPAASAVNYLSLGNAATGNDVTLYGSGTDGNVSINLIPKGTGTVGVNSIPVATTSDIELVRANDNLSGGGLVSVSATYEVLWGSRMLVISNGRSALRAVSGFWEIACPPAGTVVTGVGGAVSTTATAAGIPMAVYDALYYILPIGSLSPSVPANFRLVNYTANVVVPSNWVLIAFRSDGGSVLFNRFALAAGQSLDAGKIQSDLTVGNTLVRRDATGSFSAGTITANALTVASVPAVTTTAAQSLSNKTIVSPTITGTVTGTSVPHAVPSGMGKVVASPINTEVTSPNFAWVPGLTNDLAYAYERGATITVTKNGTALTQGGVAAAGVTDYNQYSVFNQDNTPQTSGYGGRLAINSLALNDVVVITVGGLVSPVGLSTAAAVAMGVSFSGSAPANVKIEAFFNGAWNTAYDSVNSPADAQIHLKAGYVAHGAYPIEQLRYTFTNNTVGGFRMNPLFFAANSGPKHAGPLFPRGGGNLYGTTALPPRIDATGNDANIDLLLTAKGTGVVKADNIEVATISGSQGLSNKTISGASNTLANIPQSAITSLTTDLAARQTTAQKGVANGYASLDGTGKLPADQLPALVSVLSYRGTWNASTNSPALANGTGTAGHTYRVDTAGTALGSTFAVGDYVIYTGTVWQKSLSTDDATRNAVERTAVATLTNKTLTAPVLTSPTITGSVTTTSLAQSVASGTSNYVARPLGPRPGYGTSNVSFVPGVHNYLTNLVERGCSVTITQNGTPLAGVNVSQLFRGLENTNSYTVLTGAVNDVYVIEADITAISTGNGTNWGGTSGIIYDNGPARDTKIEWFYNGAWNTVYESLNNPTVFHWGGSGGQQGSPVTKIRWTLISNATSMFIVELFHNSLYAGNVTKWLPATGGSVYGSAALPPTLQAAGADANIDLDLRSKGTGVVEANGLPVVTTTGTATLTNKTLTSPRVNQILDTNGNVNVVCGAVPSAVNYVQFNGGAAGSGVQMFGAGTDTNIELGLLAKGTGKVVVAAGGGRIAQFNAFASSVNYLTVNSGATGNAPSVFAEGSDGNIGINLVPKGTGSVTVNGNHAVNKTAAVPATPTSTGIVGQVAYDATHFYVCTATNTWRRAALSAGNGSTWT
jgi:hypothetical protein